MTLNYSYLHDEINHWNTSSQSTTNPSTSALLKCIFITDGHSIVLGTGHTPDSPCPEVLTIEIDKTRPGVERGEVACPRAMAELAIETRTSDSLSGACLLGGIASIGVTCHHLVRLQTPLGSKV